MSRNNSGAAIGAFVAGLGVGVALSLLFAPQSGDETRELIAEKARQGRDFVADTVDDLKSQASGAVEQAKGKVREAVQVGKDAYRDELHHQRNA
jgi:gas vesicle protein